MRGLKIQAGGGSRLYPSGSLLAGGAPVLPAMDGIWSLQLSNPDYTGYAVRAGLAADSGATTLDIGFNADGSFDMDAYEAFGTGSERITILYDQSGNGFNFSRSWSATLCPIIRTSTYNNKPCLYFDGTSYFANAGFNDWDGATDVSFFTVRKMPTQAVGALFGNASSGMYYSLAGAGTERYGTAAVSFATYRQFPHIARSAGALDQYLYDGGDQTLKLNENNVLQTAGVTAGTPPTTFTPGAGLGLAAFHDGTNVLNSEIWAFYYAKTVVDADAVTAFANYHYFDITQSQVFCCGDSLTYNQANGGPASPQSWPAVLIDTLETSTGTTWETLPLTTTSESGATTARVLQLMEAFNSVLDKVDIHLPNHVVVIWAGTNNLAAGDSAATALAGAVTDAQAAVDVGATVYYLNMLPRLDLGAGNAAFEAKRLTYNAGIEASLSGIATVVDVAGIPELQDPTDLTYYDSDEVHINDTGNAIVADAVAAAIEAGI